MKAILKTLLAVVGIPVLVASVYFALFASDIHVSEARVAIRSAGNTSSLTGLGALLSAPVTGSAQQNSLVVMDYSQSLDMVEVLQEKLDIVGHYSQEEIDWLARLPADATPDELLEYFRRMVTIGHDSGSDILTITVRAFSAEMARDMAEEIILNNERLVNRLSNRMESDALETARADVERAADRIRSTVQDISRFQERNDSVSPSEESAALFSRVAALESRLTEVRAERDEKLAYMRPGAPEIVALDNRERALERQISLEKGRVSGGDSNLGRLMETFQPLKLEQEIAQQQYAAALASYESARADAQRQKQYLVTFVEPNLPHVATEPKRVNRVLLVALFAFLAWLIGGLFWSALREHIGH